MTVIFSIKLATNWKCKFCTYAIQIFCISLIKFLFMPVYAQEHNITASGFNTTINNESANQYNIIDGKVEGKNLFHSFDKFNLDKGETAYFTNNLNLSINNIVSRVTGSASIIDGKINTQEEFGQANFFLINPKGIVFKSNASLDIGGSFYASTADSLQFNDDKVLYADSEKPIYLSSAEPSAFGFLDDVATAIDVNGSELTVAPGKTVLLASGGIHLDGGSIKSNGGQIALISRVDANGRIALDNKASDDFREIGDITLKNGARIESGDKISIKAQRLVIMDNSRIEHITNSQLPQDSEGGAIVIEVSKQLLLTRGGAIISQTTDKVHAGDIIINAKSADISISAKMDTSRDEFSRISSSASDGGIAGDITITASTLNLNQAGRIQATNAGFGDQDEQGNSKARAGDINLTLEVLRISQGGSITNQTAGDASGGTITITANDIEIIGEGQTQVNLSSGNDIQPKPNPAEINADTTVFGTGGDIIINAKKIEIRNAGKILAESSSIFPELFGDRDIAQSGSITINASERFTMDNQSQVSLSTVGANAGDIVIQANNLFHLNDSTITTSVAEGQGGGGNITINDRVHKNLVVITGASKILATAKQGEGGNIDINAYSHLIFSDTVINASSEQGIDGQVNIVTPEVDATTGLLALPELYLDVSSLLDNSCISRTASNQSRFVVSSRDGLASTPDTLLASRLSDFDIPTKVSHVEQQPMHGLRLSNLATPVNCL